ncbi:uncharacterized protein LOC134195079 [Corticium candelabrum]|uniref:uncharacterized protein LOC134195079 n=1 Tax=Corticium candelabrum TaxID=121492 RepID=UPI002E260CA8|nr:uncharacterized protein LOC134195079 [Corticium candelabrum]
MAVAVTFDHFDQRTPYHLTTISTVRLLDCSFRLFLSAAPSFTSVFGASNSSERAAAIKLTFSGKETLQMVVSFQRCSFDDVEMKTSTTINIQFSDGASNNRVEIQNCHFTNCTAKFGAASLINFNTNAVNNTVHFSHTRFRSLTAILQGGAAVVRFIDAHENFVFFMNCTFSHVAAHDLLGIGALLAAYSNVRTSVATLFDSSSSHQIVIGNANVHNNIAADGVIYGKSISLLLTGRSEFCCSSNSFLSLYGSRLTMTGNQSFTSNRAHEGGAITLYDNSILDFSQIDRLVLFNNSALASGGGIYSDPDSGQPFVEWINRRIGVAEQERCFVNIKHISIDFRNNFKFLSNTSKIQFYGNTANSNGIDISAASFTRCYHLFSSCSVLSTILREQLVPADNRLQYAFNLVNAYPQSAEQENCTTVKQSLFTTPVHAQVASNINWLFFEAASCSCFKQIVDQKQLGFYWLFKQVCNATKIADYSLSRFPISNASVPIKRALNPLRVTYQFPFPPEEMFYVPWAHSWLSQFLDKARDQEVSNTVLLTSHVTLTPSPGETFQLNLRAFDQFLRAVNDSVAFLSLTPPHEKLQVSPSMALLRQGHNTYKRSSSIIFIINEPIIDISLLGLVNGTGTLWISATSIFSDNPIILSIAFRLSPCHLGFTAKNVDIDTAHAYIVEYDNPSIDFDESLLSCQCIDSNAISACSQSKKTVLIKERTWAGDLNANLDYFTQSNPHNGTLDELLAPEFNKRFGWGSCVLNFCKEEVVQGNWLLNDIDPCAGQRAGRLCGTCQPGLTITPFDLQCQDCTGSTGKAGIFFVVFLIVAGSFLLLAISIFTDISKSTTYDTLLFVAQVNPYLLPVGTTSSYIVSKLTYLYVARICFTDTFPTAAYLGFQILVPMFLLLLLLVLVVTNLRPIRRLLTLPRALKAVVFILSITYFNFTVAGMEFLRANRLFAEDNIGGGLVVFINGSSAYTGSGHIGFIPLGLLIIIAAAVLPVLAVAYQNHPRIKPLSDIYTSFYDDQHRWWVTVNLWRRFALALLAVGISMAPLRNIHFVRQNTLLASVLVLTVMHLIFQPFRTKFANTFETVILFNMCLLSGMSIATSGLISYNLFLVVAFWPFFAGLIILLYNHKHRIADVFLRVLKMCKGRNHSSKNVDETNVEQEKEMDSVTNSEHAVATTTTQ